MSSEEEEWMKENKGDFMVILAKEIIEHNILLLKSQLPQKTGQEQSTKLLKSLIFGDLRTL